MTRVSEEMQAVQETKCPGKVFRDVLIVKAQSPIQIKKKVCLNRVFLGSALNADSPGKFWKRAPRGVFEQQK